MNENEIEMDTQQWKRKTLSFPTSFSIHKFGWSEQKKVLPIYFPIVDCKGFNKKTRNVVDVKYS